MTATGFVGETECSAEQPASEQRDRDPRVVAERVAKDADGDTRRDEVRTTTCTRHRHRRRRTTHVRLRRDREDIAAHSTGAFALESWLTLDPSGIGHALSTYNVSIDMTPQSI
jgi:hypothetical protein